MLSLQKFSLIQSQRKRNWCVSYFLILSKFPKVYIYYEKLLAYSFYDLLQFLKSEVPLPVDWFPEWINVLEIWCPREVWKHSFSKVLFQFTVGRDFSPWSASSRAGWHGREKLKRRNNPWHSKAGRSQQSVSLPFG